MMTVRRTLLIAAIAVLAMASAAEARGPPAFVGSLSAAPDVAQGATASGGKAQGLAAMASVAEPANEPPATASPTPTTTSDVPSPTETADELVQDLDDAGLPIEAPKAPGPAAPPAPGIPDLPDVPAPAPAPRLPSTAEVATTWAPIGLMAIAVAVGLAPAISGRGPFRRTSPADSHAPEVDTSSVRRALDLIAGGQAPEAARAMQRALQRRPADPEARYVLGVALARDGLVGQALRELEYAIRLNDVFLGLMVRDPALEGFVSRPEVHRFIRRHARSFHDRVHRAYV